MNSKGIMESLEENVQNPCKKIQKTELRTRPTSQWNEFIKE